MVWLYPNSCTHSLGMDVGMFSTYGLLWVGCLPVGTWTHLSGEQTCIELWRTLHTLLYGGCNHLHWNPSCSKFLPPRGTSNLFAFSHCVGWEWHLSVVFICISLMAAFAISIPSFMKCLFKYLLILMAIWLLFGFMVSLYILETSPLSDLCITKISFQPEAFRFEWCLLIKKSS